MSQSFAIEKAFGDDAHSRPIRVLLLIKGLGRGGAEQLLVHAVEYGDSSRFEYHVAYVLPWKDAFVPHLQALGVRVTCLDGPKGLAWIGRLKRLLKECEIDLVHVHSPYVAAFLRAALGRRRPVLVTTEHNVWDRYRRGTYWANALTFPRSDHVFTVSDEVGESIRYPIPLAFLRRPPVETLHHGIDVRRIQSMSLPGGVREELAIPSDAPVVGTVANFKPHKGHEYMVKVAELVAHERPDVRFVIVGGGPLQQHVRQEAERLGLGETMVFPGFRDDALRLANAFDVYAMSSLHEGLPLTLLEAMALGRPPVATRVGGVTAIIEDRVSGFIVEPRDPVAQASRILTLLEDQAMRARFGAAARQRAAAFDVRNAVRSIEHRYSELVR